MSVATMRPPRLRVGAAPVAITSAPRRGGTAHTGLTGGGKVPDIQRARIVAAMVTVARERGAAGATVSHVVARSGVSRRTFYEMFADRDACFLAALELAIERGAARVVPAFAEADEGAGKGTAGGKGVAYRGADRWRAQLRAGLAALLEFIRDEPELGGLCVVDALSAGPEAQRRRSEIVVALVDAVDAARGEASPGLAPTRLTAEAVVGGVLGVLHARISERDPRPVGRLLSPLMAMIVLPYFGPEAATQERERPVPRSRQRPQQSPSNPLEGLDMRLTYRTMRVLAAIAECGGQRASLSNREVADASDVHDQGQISKLLVRLERLGLVENAGRAPGEGRIRGEPNAWRLTPRGGEVERVIREQATPTGARR
jgi:AcrR family transcriptional regulator